MSRPAGYSIREGFPGDSRTSLHFSFLSVSSLTSQTACVGFPHPHPLKSPVFHFSAFHFSCPKHPGPGLPRCRPLKFPVFHFSAFHYSHPKHPFPELRVPVFRRFPFFIIRLFIYRFLLSRITINSFSNSAICCPRDSFSQLSLCCIRVLNFPQTLVPISGGLSARDASSCLFLLCCSAIPLVHASEARCSYIQLLGSQLLCHDLFGMSISCIPGLSAQQFCGSDNWDMWFRFVQMLPKYSFISHSLTSERHNYRLPRLCSITFPAHPVVVSRSLATRLFASSHVACSAYPNQLTQCSNAGNSACRQVSMPANRISSSVIRVARGMPSQPPDV